MFTTHQCGRLDVDHAIGVDSGQHMNILHFKLIRHVWQVVNEQHWLVKACIVTLPSAIRTFCVCLGLGHC